MQVRITDRVLVVVLFVVMAIFSTVMVVNLRENIANTDRLREAVDRDRVLSEVGIICTLDTSGAVNTEAIPYTPEAIEKYVNECIAKEATERNISIK